MSPEELLVLFVGRLVPEKGIDSLLEAWRLAAVSNGVLALVGEGPGRPAADISTRCVGAIPNADLPAWYAAADVVVLPSVPTRTFLEPWGLVLNEAMLQGTPVIASDAVGAAAGGLVRSGRNGLVVEAGDADSLARAIRTLAGDSTLRERLGSAAREDAARFTPAAWVEGVRQALEAVGGKR
jgi:glycosyltransferase involved in cell wall biosynthesis